MQQPTPGVHRRRRLKVLAPAIGDWLATVGWAKFFFIAFLLMIVGAIADNVFYDTKPIVVVKRARAGIASRSTCRSRPTASVYRRRARRRRRRHPEASPA